jgi:hypothetical protein
MGSIPLPALDLKPVQQPDPMGDVSKLMALKSMMTQQASQQQELQIRQQQIKDQQATTAAMKDWDGKDYDALSKSVLQNGGSATAASAIQQHGLTIKKTVSDIAKQDSETGSKNLETFIGKHKAIGDTLEGIEQVPDNQIHAVAAQKVGELANAGILDPQTAQKAMQGIQSTQDPAALRQQIDVLAKSSMGAKAAGEQAKTESETKKNAAQQDEAEAATALKKQESKYYQDHGGAPNVSLDKQEYADYLSNPKLDSGIKKDAATFASWKAKQSPAALTLNNMLGKPGEGSAVDQAAERYSQTGELPAGFARSPGTTAAIIKRSAELHPDQNLAGNKATFAADTAALKKVQTQFDSMNAFEGTALKNLDLYIEKAKAIPDLGAKFANVPLRAITGNMIGTKAMAELEAARQTASTEVAKVLGSATGSGVLSDSQKQEALDVLNGNLPLSASVGVVETLKRDMGNRHQSYLDDINAIKGRMGSKTSEQPASTAQPGAAKTSDFFSQFGGKAK